MNKIRTILLLVCIGVLAVAGAFFIYPGSIPGISLSQWRPWKLGLDLVGGSALTYEADLSDVDAGSRSSVMEGLRDVIEQRVNLFGVSEPNVVVGRNEDQHLLIVELAGIQNTDEAIAQIGKTAKLDFQLMRDGEEGEPEFVQTALTGKFLKGAQVAFHPTTAEPQIALQFDSEGADLFEEITTEHTGEQLCAFVDNIPFSCPRIQEIIPNGQAVISGQFTLDETKQLVNLFNAGALPAPISLISQRTISATLGKDSLQTAIMAGTIGTVLIMLFMALYYRRSAFGVFAAVALGLYIILTLSFFKIVPVTMTLAGIAGFLLSIGMAVDANILIFERIKEERRRGLRARAAIEEGFRRAWPSIRDSNITTILSAIILYYFTSSFVKGFALTLLIGVVMSMLTAIIVTRGLLRVFVANHD